MLSETKHKSSHEEGLKISTTKEILQRLPIALAYNTFENLLNEIRQNVYALYRSK